MENTKSQWPEEKAQIHLKVVCAIIIFSGVHTMFSSFKRFADLGISGFIIPYLFNIIDFFFGIFQIYAGIILKNRKLWARAAVFVIVSLKIAFDFFLDQKEFFIMLGVLFYFIYVFRDFRMGWLFNKNTQNSGKS